MGLDEISDDELLARVERVWLDGCAVLAKLLLLLIEIEDRRLDLKTAHPSLYAFCRTRLGMSDGAAHRRIIAARLVKRFPRLLARIESGDIALSSLVLLNKHLDENNLDEVIGLASRKSKREVEEIVARLAPRPDVPAEISVIAEQRVLSVLPTATTPPAESRIEPLAEERYKVQLTASRELREKLERAIDLMRHRNPSGDLATVVESGVELLIEKLEKERLGKTSRPKRGLRGAKRGRVTNAVRRQVAARDAEQCVYRDAKGNRCSEKGFLEFDHRQVRARGGSDNAPNIRMLCRGHNRLHAEEVFGKEHVERKIQEKSTELFDLATRGLVGMGFKTQETRRALEIVLSRHAQPPPVQQVLVEALRVLT
jgi:hypothetical protein